MTKSTTQQNLHDWVLVLAGGDGKRLRALTTASGVAVPKQYCSLAGGQTLLDDTIERAQCVAPADRVSVIVAAQHRAWWGPLLDDIDNDNVIVQPKNRGTGVGLMYGVLHIAARDPDARILALPADHYVRDEALLCERLRRALRELDRDPQSVVLLGVEPDHVDCELGYIVPGTQDGEGVHRVSRFVEKPDEDVAASLIAQGALWNTFILAGTARALIELFAPRYWFAVFEMQALLAHARQRISHWPALLDLYERLPDIDFSHEVLGEKGSQLRVLPVPGCGWSDLGTPRRVAQTIQSLPKHALTERGRTPFVDLARQPGLSVLAQGR
jgi:mannose-1-phosphate guanylyltransferase